MSIYNSLCFGWRKKIGGSVSIKSFVESLQVVLEYLDQESCKLEGLDSIRATFAQIVAMEIRNAMNSTENAKEQSATEDQTDNLKEAMRVIQAKTEHIEQLEQLIHELQTSLREEVDKPGRQGESPSGQPIGDDFLDEIKFEDNVSKTTVPTETLRKRLATLFRINGVVAKPIGRNEQPAPDIGAEDQHSNFAEVPEESVQGTLIAVMEETPETGSGKRRQKKLIHYTNESGVNKLASRSRGLNDFDEYYY